MDVTPQAPLEMIVQLLDREIVDCTALVVDPNPTSRSILASQLRDFGVGSVVQCGRVKDARRHLESKPFDMVLCEHRFDAEDPGYTAQHLLDDLRKAHLLPLSTVFIVVTGEASYTMVAEAAESALDSYLLKPYTASALGERLQQARKRKKALADIFRAIEQEQFEHATRLCLHRFASRAAYWLYAARIGSELLLRQGLHAEAKTLCETVLATGALPWARLGIARAQIGASQPTQAMRTLDTLIAEHPSHVDAYDVMGRVQVEQGALHEALDTYRKAASLTPSSIARLQKVGMLAFFVGQRDEATKALDRAATLGLSSKMFDAQSLVVLAMGRAQQGDSKGVQRCLDNLTHLQERAPDNPRLKRLTRIVAILHQMQHRQVAAVLDAVRELCAELHDPALDMEGACNLLMLLSQLSASELRLDDCESWVDTLAQRFASSKALTELLAAACVAHPPLAGRVREAQHRIAETAEQALSHTVRGNHRTAVLALMAHGERTMNPKLVDMARKTLQRHSEHIHDAADLAQRADVLHEQLAPRSCTGALGHRTGRAPGALLLRQLRPTSEAEAA